MHLSVQVSVNGSDCGNEIEKITLLQLGVSFVLPLQSYCATQWRTLKERFNTGLYASHADMHRLKYVPLVDLSKMVYGGGLLSVRMHVNLVLCAGTSVLNQPGCMRSSTQASPSQRIIKTLGLPYWSMIKRCSGLWEPSFTEPDFCL